MQILEKRLRDHDFNYGRFPCNAYLNNALYLLLKSNYLNDSKILSSVEELCWCIIRADGYFTEENIDLLMLHNVSSFVWDNPLLNVCPNERKYFNVRYGWISDESRFACYSSFAENLKESVRKRVRNVRLLCSGKGG